MNKIHFNIKSIYFSNFSTQVKRKEAISFLLVLIAVDMLFVTLHVAKEIFPIISEDLFSITKDQALPEIYQYLKLAAIVLFLLMLSRNLEDRAYMSWAILFAYLFIDDAFSVHENLGFMISDRFQMLSPFGIRPQDYGELVVTAFFSGILLSIICFFFVKGSGIFQEISMALGILLVFLGFFGVVVDMLVMVQNFGAKGDFLFSMLEDGGEMVVVSFILYYTFALQNKEFFNK